MVGLFATTTALAIAAYGISSYILLRKPELLHRRKRFPLAARHISHRGGAGEMIENSIEAFEFAVSKGTHLLELDCQLTKDHQVVVFHDNTLDRCTGTPGQISDFPYGDLPVYLNQMEVQFDLGNVCDRTGHPQCKIALLEDIFKRFPTVPIVLEIKTDNDDMIREVDRLVRSYGREKLTIWGGVTGSISSKCRRINPDMLTYPYAFYVLFIYVSYYLGLAPFLPIPYDCFTLPIMSKFRNPKSYAYRGHQGLFARFLLCSLDWMLTSRAFIEHLSRRGIPVFLWVANNEEEFRFAFDLGAAGVMTDYPSRLSAFLSKASECQTPPSLATAQLHELSSTVN